MLKYKKGLLAISKIMLRNCNNIHPNITGAKKIILLSITIITLSFLSILFYSSDNSSALTYSSNVEVGFTFNPTISVNLSGDLLINNLSPGSVSDSNTINVNVSTNASQGYVLTATSGTKTTNTDLVNQTNSAYKFSSIATNASLSNLTTDNTWGYSYSEDSGTNWSNYSGLPLDNDDEGATGKQLINTINPADNRTLQFKIAARASSNQAAGTYQNTINFYAVANPDPTLQPVSCPAGKVCYNANSLTPVQGEMGQQTPTTSELTDGITLWAPNFKNSGYGFAGWSDTVTNNGAKYGPNQTITVPSDLDTNGLSLYAIWVKSAGDMQNWGGCDSMSKGEVTALKDVRDNDVYAVAKLADGNCWMIENLRLDDSAALTTANTHKPSLPLTNTWWYSSANNNDTEPTSNKLSVSVNPTTTAWCQAYNSNCEDQSMLYTGNTTDYTANTSSAQNSNIYSYGNYYNWYSATAGNGTNSQEFGDVSGDICPAGWTLPTGNASQEIVPIVDVVGHFYILNKALSGTDTGATASKNLRAYPNNFVYSSNVLGSSINGRGYTGGYWSSSAFDSNYACYLNFNKDYVYPGTNGYYKFTGLMVRCIKRAIK